eukprot:5613724-Pyramimonas_sp.AAC.1
MCDCATGVSQGPGSRPTQKKEATCCNGQCGIRRGGRRRASHAKTHSIDVPTTTAGQCRPCLQDAGVLRHVEG